MTEVQHPIQQTEQPQPPLETHAAPTPAPSHAPEPLNNERSFFKKGLVRAGAAAAAAAFVAGGLFAFTRGGEEDTAPVAEKPPAQEDAPPATNAVEQEPPAATTGVIELRDFDPNEPSVSFSLSDGREVKVNTLPDKLDVDDPESVDLFMNRFLGLFAAGYTSGEDDVLKELSSLRSAQEDIKRVRTEDEWALPVVTNTSAHFWYFSIFDSPKHPAEFNVDTTYQNPMSGNKSGPRLNTYYITLDPSSDLRFHTWMEYANPRAEWQAPDTRALDYPYGRSFSHLGIEVTLDANNRPTVGDINWDIQAPTKQ